MEGGCVLLAFSYALFPGLAITLDLPKANSLTREEQSLGVLQLQRKGHSLQVRIYILENPPAE